MLRYRAFRLYFIGQALSTFGDSLVPLTIAFAALQVGGAGALGLVLAANRLPIAVLVLFGGALGDRWNRRRVMIGADALRACTQAIAGLLLVSGQAELWHLVVLQALAGAGTAVFTPAAAGVVPELVPRSRLQQANALIGLVTNTNKVLSISAAGVLVTATGPGVTLLVDAATFAASAGSLLMLRLPAEVRKTGRRSLWSEVRAGARLVAKTPWLRAMLSYSALLQAVVIGPHMVAGPLLAAELCGGAGAWATIGVLQAIGSILGGAVVLRWRPRYPLVAAMAVGLLMVPYLLLFSVRAPLWLVAAAAVAVGAQGAVFLAVQSTLIQSWVPDGAVSRVSAWSQLGNLVLLPASLAVTGPVAAEVGGSVVLLASTVWLVVSTLGAVSYAVRHKPRNEAASPAVSAGEAAVE